MWRQSISETRDLLLTLYWSFFGLEDWDIFLDVFFLGWIWFLPGPKIMELYWEDFTWKIGDMRHMSIRPEPRYWPVERKNVRRGMPKQSESSRNWAKLFVMNIGDDLLGFVIIYHDDLWYLWWSIMMIAMTLRVMLMLTLMRKGWKTL